MRAQSLTLGTLAATGAQALVAGADSWFLGHREAN
jgi:hypothetical protein